MQIRGKVYRGKKRGKRLGFPTANVFLETSIPEGIYVSVTVVGNKTYPSLTFIGAAQTYNESLYQSETYIFDFDQEIYDQEIAVSLLKKIRDNKKFASELELVKQMEDDRIVALSYFKDETDK